MVRLSAVALIAVTGCRATDEPRFELGFGPLDPPPTAAVSPPTDGEPTGTDLYLRDPRFDPVVDVLVDEMSRNLGLGVSIAVMQGGILTWAEGIGSANPFDPEGRSVVNPHTLFQIGGVTRTLTAAVAMQQVGDGLIAVDDPVGALLPAFDLDLEPSWPVRATLHDLLSNQSGLYDYNDWHGSSRDGDLASWHYGFYAHEMWPMNGPGLFFNPANTNYALAGLVVEEHDPANRYFADIAREDLFAPLGMYDTFLRKADVEADGTFALSTGLRDEVFGYADIPMDEVPDAAYARPGDLAWSTASDLCTWGAFLVHGDGGDGVLGDAQRTALVTPYLSSLDYDDHQQFGYGLYLWDQYPFADGYHALPVWEHTGWTPSFSSRLVIAPDADVVVAILSNGYHDAFPATIEAVLRATIDPLPALTGYAGPVFDPAQVGDQAGTYEDAFNLGDIVVAVADDDPASLTIDIPDLTSQGFVVDEVLEPVSTDHWILYVNSAPLDLTFVRDPDGDVAFVRNALFVGTKL